MDEADFRGLIDELKADGGLASRRRRLSRPALALHQRILHTFAGTGAAPTPEVIRGWAAGLGVDAGAALAEMVGVDLVQADPGALRVLGAYPFAAGSRGHRVDIEGGPAVEAYCAIDAIGIAAMLERRVTITSRDRRTGAEVRVEVGGDEARSEPPGVVVSMPAVSDGSDQQAGDCECPAVNFYMSAESARADEPAPGRLLILTLPQAHRFATAAFGGHIEQVAGKGASDRM